MYCNLLHKTQKALLFGCIGILYLSNGYGEQSICKPLHKSVHDYCSDYPENQPQPAIISSDCQRNICKAAGVCAAINAAINEGKCGECSRSSYSNTICFYVMDYRNPPCQKYC